jgi:PAS domain S-box-containing protein
MLRKSGEQYKTLADNVSDVLWIVDLDLKFTYISPSVTRQEGYLIEEAMGRNLEECLSPESYSVAMHALREQLEIEDSENCDHDRSLVLELEKVRKDGTKFWAELKMRFLRDHDNRPIGIIGITRDISERKQTKRLLYLLRKSIESVKQGVTIADKDGVIIFTNKAEAEMHGYEIDELIGQKARILAPRELWHELTIENLKKNKYFERETVNVRKDGTEFPVRLSSVPVPANSHSDEGIICISQDITDRVELEGQLRHAQKMEAVGVLAGGIAHDFNNILTAIIGYTNMLETKMAKNDPLRVYVGNVLSASERAAFLTQSLLAYSRKQVIRPVNIDINNIIRQFEKMLPRLLGEDIEVNTVLSEQELCVRVDHSQIDQVIMNIAINARGCLTIRTDKADLDDSYCMKFGLDNGIQYLCLSMSDTGEGMNAKTRKKIFEPFFTTKEVGKGTGLGLSMVYGIIQQHEGYVDVKSKVGKGTTFNIYLPIISEKSYVYESTEKEVPAIGIETVLVAEDDESVRELIRTVLEEYGYEVITAKNGEEAIQKFRVYEKKIDLLLLDVIMPKNNGKEVYEKITKLKPDVKILFVSGYSGEILAQRGVLEAGMDLIAKPVRSSKLLRKVREVLEK